MHRVVVISNDFICADLWASEAFDLAQESGVG